MYYLLYVFFYVLSLLPWRVIYFISDIAYCIIYYIIRYRREIVLNNLTIAFPEKTEKEKEVIAKEFYHNFVDNFIEVIKMFSISKKELNRHFTGNFELLNETCASGKSVQVHLGHFFNWEFANIFFASNAIYPFLVVYMPIENKAINKIFYKIRTRFGTHLIAATQYRKDFAPFAKNRYALILVGDQNPANPNNSYWVDFFGRKVPVVKGPERGAIMNDNAILMAKLTKVKRGFYKAHLELLTTEPTALPEGAITKKMITFFEDSIREQPSNYLWSHRRWKWKFDPEKHGKLVIH
jgi:KDO2-lipid IV(A) lauroyltransferase